jgi:fructose 1,6-bisphosphate aldolase/phosphatase
MATVSDMLTLSIIKADIGGFPGHSDVHPDLKAKAREVLEARGRKAGLVDWCIASVGDDLALILSHHGGPDNADVHGLAWDVFRACTEVAKGLHLYGAGQDLLSDAFSGNVRGMGPGVAELTFRERTSEPTLVFLADKTEPGAWNWPLYKIFADPFNTPGLVIDPRLHTGFRFEVQDLVEDTVIQLDCPEESYDLLTFIGTPGRYAVRAVHSRAMDEMVAASSTQRLSLIAGRYVGKDDPVMVIRAQNGLPAQGEVLEAFAHPHLVAGWMRGSHVGPLIPVGQAQATPTRFDGPPRVVCLGFQLANGRLVGPADLFADLAFDRARQEGLEMADFMRRQGPFEPHRLPMEEMEYTSMPDVMARLKDRFTKLAISDRHTGSEAKG